MNLKQRFSLFYSILFCALLAISLTVIYYLYARFRQNEFKERLEIKAQTTFRFLMEVKEIDHDLLKVIDRNTINSLYDEKVLVFDTAHKIIYSSIDDKKITYSESILNDIYKQGELFEAKNGDEMLGIKLYEGKIPFLVMASANDKQGKRMLDFLKYTLIGVFVFSLLIIWFSTYYFAKKAIRPLEELKLQVQNVTENNLNQRVSINSKTDELTELSRFFNLMLDRLEKSFSFQKNFIHHASHELRTPLTALKLQIENAMAKTMTEADTQKLLSSIAQDQKQLSDLLDALLLLSKFEDGNANGEMSRYRVDEIIFKAVNYIQSVYKDVKIHMDFGDALVLENDLVIPCNETLLAIAFGNILKNAYNYSNDKDIRIKIENKDRYICIAIENSGPTLDEQEAKVIFEPFERGKNAGNRKGYGLGLSITKRIMTVHGGIIYYDAPDNHTNRFSLELPKF